MTSTSTGLQDIYKIKIPRSEIRKRATMTDFKEYTLKQKWKWAGHIVSMKDNRWTKRYTEWQPRRGKRSWGRPSRRWQDGIGKKEGTSWNRKALDREKMEATDGGQHPEVDGQSLGERWSAGCKAVLRTTRLSVL